MDRASKEPLPFVSGSGGMRWEVRRLATRLEAPWAPAILPGGAAFVFERGGRGLASGLGGVRAGGGGRAGS